MVKAKGAKMSFDLELSQNNSGITDPPKSAGGLVVWIAH